MPDTDTVDSRYDDAMCGRLVAMPTTRTLTDLESVFMSRRGLRDNVVSIEFPAMPDTVELARRTDYAVESNMVVPDGVHQYRSTAPLEIPISFRLHAFDRYCAKGCLTLLQVAARLHSLVLPVSTFERGVSVTRYIATEAEDDRVVSGGAGKPPDSVERAQADAQNVYTLVRTGATKSGQLYAPVTCWLHLMWTKDTGPGVSCIGYVKDVRVIFTGPWLRGPERSFNLANFADFSFTFVHRPGHGNATPFDNSKLPVEPVLAANAYAHDVKDLFYNTRKLVVGANWQGFDASAESKYASGPAAVLSDIPQFEPSN